jgi:nicotinamide riboside transporter PnuC
MPKILGREPALWAALLNGAVYFLGAFLLHLSAGQEAVLIAAISVLLGLYVAFVTHDGVSAGILGVVKALLAVALGFGLKLGPDQQAVLLTFAATITAMFVRTQVTAPTKAPAVGQ